MKYKKDFQLIAGWDGVKIGLKGNDRLIIRYTEGGDCKIAGVIRRGWGGSETKCKSTKKQVSKSSLPVNPQEGLKNRPINLSPKKVR